MIRNKVSLERIINDRQYQFLVPSEAPLNECLAIVDDIRKYIVERCEAAEAEAKKAAEVVQEVPVVEPEVVA